MLFKNETEDLGTGHPNELHYHSKSTEWYFTFKGSQELLVGGTKVIVPEGQLLRIGEYCPHKISWREYPFEGMTVRTPIIPGDKVVIEPD